MRGFLLGSRWLAFAIATSIGVAGALSVTLLAPGGSTASPSSRFISPASLFRSVYGLVQIQAGIARSDDWPNLALMPFYIWRQLTITVLMGAAWLFGAPTNAVIATPRS